jgi:hypothetical protein
VIAGPPLGYYIDKSTEKKKILSIVCAVICSTWVLLAISRNHFFVGLLLSIQGLAGAVFPPGICGLSLGVAGYSRFPARTARNEQVRSKPSRSSTNDIGIASPLALVGPSMFR